MKNLLRWAGLLVLFLLLLSPAVRAQVASASPPIENTVGVNKYDLFKQYVGRASGGDGSPAYLRVTRAMGKKAIEDAKWTGVRYLRVSVSGFSPLSPGGNSDLELWLRQKDEFWRRVDAMMDDLDANSMKIVPVFAWNARQFPAMTGETLTDLIASDRSRSWRMLADYTREFVARYRHRPTIAFYELTNEMNLLVDIDRTQRCDEEEEEEGSRQGRCLVAGNVSTEDVIGFTGRLASVIRAQDPGRKVSSGFAIPRASAEHLRRRPQWSRGGADWTADSREEFRRNLVDIHRHVDIISIHLYDNAKARRFGTADTLELLRESARAAESAGKPLFVGEFGELNPDRATERTYLSRMLREMRRLRVSYGAAWVWQYYQRRPYSTYDTPPTKFNLEPGYTDFLIAQIRSYNTGSSSRAAQGDTRPPSVVLTWPLACAAVGRQAEVYAVASDDAGPVQRLEFLLDGTVIDTDAQPPYSAKLVTAGMRPGKHTLTARAYDAAGKNSEFSSDILIGGAGSAACVVTDRP